MKRGKMGSKKEMSLADGLKVIRREMISMSVKRREKANEALYKFREKENMNLLILSQKETFIAQFLDQMSRSLTPDIVGRWRNEQESFDNA